MSTEKKLIDKIQSNLEAIVDVGFYLPKEYAKLALYDLKQLKKLLKEKKK